MGPHRGTPAATEADARGDAPPEEPLDGPDRGAARRTIAAPPVLPARLRRLLRTDGAPSGLAVAARAVARPAPVPTRPADATVRQGIALRLPPATGSAHRRSTRPDREAGHRASSGDRPPRRRPALPRAVPRAPRPTSGRRPILPRRPRTSRRPRTPPPMAARATDTATGPPRPRRRGGGALPRRGPAHTPHRVPRAAPRTPPPARPPRPAAPGSPGGCRPPRSSAGPPCRP